MVSILIPITEWNVDKIQCEFCLLHFRHCVLPNWDVIIPPSLFQCISLYAVSTQHKYCIDYLVLVLFLSWIFFWLLNCYLHILHVGMPQETRYSAESESLFQGLWLFCLWYENGISCPLLLSNLFVLGLAFYLGVIFTPYRIAFDNSCYIIHC